MKIGLDLDGVVYDFGASHRDYLLDTDATYSRDELPDPAQWNTWESWDMSFDEWDRTFKEGIAAGRIFTGGHRYLFPGSVGAVQSLIAAGHDIHIITHRPPNALAATADWLAEVGIPYTSLTLAKDKSTVPVDVIIEDNVDNAYAALRAGSAPRAVLVDRPWNRTWTVDGEELGSTFDDPVDPSGGAMRRCFNWAEIVQLIDDLANGGSTVEVHAFGREEPVKVLHRPGWGVPPVLVEVDLGGAAYWDPRRLCAIDVDPRPDDPFGIDHLYDSALDQDDDCPACDGAGCLACDARHLTADQSENPKDRIGITKPRLSLVPKSAIIRIAQAFTDGAAKYGPFNWRTKRVKASVYVDAAERHLSAWFDGEDIADDSGVPHLAHAGACISLLIDAIETGNLVDDRPTPGAAARLIAELTEQAPTEGAA